MKIRIRNLTPLQIRKPLQNLPPNNLNRPQLQSRITLLLQHRIRQPQHLIIFIKLHLLWIFLISRLKRVTIPINRIFQTPLLIQLSKKHHPPLLCQNIRFQNWSNKRMFQTIQQLCPLFFPSNRQRSPRRGLRGIHHRHNMVLFDRRRRKHRRVVGVFEFSEDGGFVGGYSTSYAGDVFGTDSVDVALSQEELKGEELFFG